MGTAGKLFLVCLTAVEISIDLRKTQNGDPGENINVDPQTLPPLLVCGESSPTWNSKFLDRPVRSLQKLRQG